MIQIKPTCSLVFQDPRTKKKVEAGEIHFGGMFTYTTLTSLSGKTYLKDLPVSFGMRYGSYIDLETNELIFDSLEWYPRLFQKHHNSSLGSNDITFSETKSEKRSNNLIVLNCLDNCYGHALFKLLNIPYYQKQKGDLLVIAPSFLMWMVPEDVERVIEVDVALRDAYLHVHNLDEKVKDIMEKYQSVDLARMYPRPNQRYIDITKHVPGITPFEIDSLLTETPSEMMITMIVRDDKMWINNDIVFKLLNRFSKKRTRGILHFLLIRLGLMKIAVQLFSIWQHHKINTLYKALRKKQNINFVVLGFGKRRGLHKGIDDRRTTEHMDKETELAWAKRYAESHICLGMHGSNLCLPSLLSGMTVSLNAEGKFNKFSSDLIIKENDVRKALYRYRIIPSYIPPKKLASYLERMFNGYKKYHRNFIEQIPDSQNNQNLD